MKPQFFKTEMVYAILKKGKRQTRRLFSKPPLLFNDQLNLPISLEDLANGLIKFKKKGYYRIVTEGDLSGYMIPNVFGVGEILWVKETFAYLDFCGEDNGYVYKASENGKAWSKNTEGWKWKPSIFMPKEAARLFLKITKVDFQNLQSITEEDAILEGVSSVKEYKELWNRINTDAGSRWEDNPPVVVYDFEINEIKFNDYE